MTEDRSFRISEGEDSFRRFREENYFYVDKTDFLIRFFSSGIDRGTLFTRPRRFGKTLTLTTLRDFLDITRDSRPIFEGLAIMSRHDLVEKYMNQYPVIFLTLKDVHGQTDPKSGEPCEPLGKLKIEISRVCNTMDFLLDSSKLNRLDKKMFEELWLKEADRAATSSNDLVHGFLYHLEPASVTDLVHFLDGDSLYKNVAENLPYETIYEKGDNLWSALVMTGYLTRARAKERTAPREGLIRLRIPNREIRSIFKSEIFSFFRNKVSDVHVTGLIEAFFGGNDASAQQILGEIILHDLSYLNEFEEYAYHLLLQGIFRGAQYETNSERQHGFGRSDLIVEDMARSRAIIIEFKQAKDVGKTASEIEAALDQGIREALEQIESRKYDTDLRYKGIMNILRYGISCTRLHCKVRLARD